MTATATHDCPACGAALSTFRLSSPKVGFRACASCGTIVGFAPPSPLAPPDPPARTAVPASPAPAGAALPPSPAGAPGDGPVAALPPHPEVPEAQPPSLSPAAAPPPPPPPPAGRAGSPGQAAGPAAPAGGAAAPSARYGRLVLAVPDDGLRNAVAGALVKERVARQVVSCKDGDQLIMAVARLTARRQRPDIVVLDTALPLVDGKNAAIVLRAIEDAFETPAAPLVFYAKTSPSEEFERLLRYLKDASLVQRPELAELSGQVEVLIRSLQERT